MLNNDAVLYYDSRLQTIKDKGISLDGGVGHYTESVHFADEPQKFGLKLGLDFSFHIAVKVILLNILFGIIVDTFAQMISIQLYERREMRQSK